MTAEAGRWWTSLIDRFSIAVLWLALGVGAFTTPGMAAQASTTTAKSATFTYDLPVIARVAVHQFGAVGTTTALRSGAEGSVSRPVEGRGTSATSVGDVVATDTAGAADDLTRVGRWMSPEEHAAMVRTGEVQVGGGGTTYVANPANVNAFPPNRFPSNYVEFDVPTGSLRPGQSGWAQIPSPDSVWGRLAAKQGVTVQSPVSACNIVLVATRTAC